MIIPKPKKSSPAPEEPANFNCNMYYTGKGDKGTTKLFDSKDRIPKSDQIFEVLGSLDELNSHLGLCSVEAKEIEQIYSEILYEQNNLFILQAHFAGAKVEVKDSLVSDIEKRIERVSVVIKPRKSFVVPGGSRLSALLDIARTLARKTERSVISLDVKEREKYNPLVLVYLNRLSSFFYVLARLANDILSEEESAPKY